MNKQEREKKERESKCLNTAINNLLSQKGDSKRIGKLMSGIDVERDSGERPDFIRYLVPKSPNERGIVVGIEQFRVDHISNLTKNDRYQSLGIIHQKRTEAYYNKWRETILNSEGIPEESISEMCDVLSHHSNNAAYATIHTFISSFKQDIDTHMESIDEYESAIRFEADKRNADHMLIILIEVHSAFQNLFFHHNRKIHYENTPVMLVLDEFIQLLEKADKRVDYYVLSFSDTLNINTKTITVNARDIRGSLKKQHIPIYHYCGADLFLSENEAFIKDYHMDMKHEEQGEKITFNASPSMRMMRPEYKLKYTYNALMMVYYYYAKKEPVVLDFDVEAMCEVLFPYIVNWRKSPDDDGGYEPVFWIAPTEEYVKSAYKEFYKRWNLDEILNQDISTILDSLE
ncbi:hypothetical protein [Ruminococcus flavefaciens]|uniref:hypothetical protein n=1 Tax=Ruminococcus flavefaciens TaxID=1265 RepID=UPI00048BEF27|nr:hypothetical protein [Ruminococcus flavefaciens]